MMVVVAEPNERPGWWSRAGIALIYLAVAAVAVWARMHESGIVFVDDQVLPQDGDSAYHLRRMVSLALEPRYPGLFDPLTNWPNGSPSMWAPGFDWLGAAFIRLLGAGSSPIEAARAAALLPVVLGATTTLLVMWVARRLVPSRTVVSAAAGFIFALTPVCIDVGMVGRTDHHTGEQLCVILLVAWALALVRSDPEPSARRRVGLELVGALLLAASLWLQSIALVPVALVAVVAFAAAWWGGPDGTASRPGSPVGTGAPAFLLAATILAGLFAPAVAEHGRRMSYSYPSYFQPLFLLWCGLAVLAATQSHRLTYSKLHPGRRLAVSAGLAAAAAGALLLVVPDLARSLRGGVVDYLAVGDRWLAANVELRAPFALFPARTQWIDVLLGTAGWVAPVTLPAAIWLLRRDRRAASVIALVTAALTLLALTQARWVRPFAIVLVLCTAIAWEATATAIAGRLRSQGRRAGRLAYGLVMLAGVGVVLVREGHYLGEPSQLPASASVHGAAIYLRHHGKEPSAGNHAGVLAEWSSGYQILAVSGRPILAGGFGPFAEEDGFELEQRAWYGSQDDLWKLMQERDLGYVVAGWDSFQRLPFEGQAALDLGAGAPNPAFYRSVPLAPLVTAGSAIPELDVPHLERLCPVYASPIVLRDFAFPLPRLWVYELVPGAVLEGRAAPHSRVVAEMPLHVGASDVPYAAYADVGAEGTFALRFPVPTAHRTGTLSSADALRIHRVDAPSVTVSVSSDAVLAGSTIRIPDG
jgi:hypothetical protein